MKFLFILLSSLFLMTGCCNKNESVSVVPYPNQIEVKCGSFDVAEADFHFDSNMDEASKAAIQRFHTELCNVSGKETALVEGIGNNGVNFLLDPSLNKEEYILNISSDKAEVKANSLNGFIYAIQTVKQLLPSEIFSGEPHPEVEMSMPCVEIKDQPRFVHRGALLDVARHYFTPEDIKRFIDVLEMHKMNVFHWHITDDQGWRLEIKKYPRLTEVGAWRKETCIGRDYSKYDGKRHGGFYSQDEVKEIVEYAAARGITVIPEIDLPGHMLGAISSYPYLGCKGNKGNYEVWCRWGVSEDVLCIGKETTFEFLEDVLDEVMELFPSKYIHIGGDECPKVAWTKCPFCQSKIQELGLVDKDGRSAEDFLHSYAMSRVEKYLNDHGRQIIGWDEMLEGEVAPNATVMSWRGEIGGIEAVKLGHDVIMTPNTYCYLDYSESNIFAPGQVAIAGFLPTEVTYGYEPYSEKMTEEERKHILGIQGNLWTEHVKTTDYMFYMLLPRLAAISEIGWCNADRKDYDRFLNSTVRLAKIYEEMDVNYCKNIFDVNGETVIEDGVITLSLSTIDNAPIRYTLDGTEPDENSSLYSEPVKLTEDCTVWAKSFGIKKVNPYKNSFTIHKALGKKITLDSPTREKYTFNAPELFVDGVTGDESYIGGKWAGWDSGTAEVTIDMAGVIYSDIIIRNCINTDTYYAFPPSCIEVLTSEDGKVFTSVNKKEIAEETAGRTGIEIYKISIPETSAKYLKIRMSRVDPLPQWHYNHLHNNAHLFVDEIIVR